ncbi:mitochondrial carrier protein, putative, partial [Hepatocystis sp. ex Piliocolobus tephrosceles]
MEYLQNFVTGALAGLTVDFILYPIDFINTNTQLKQELRIFSLFEAKKLYSGIIPTLLGTIPYSACFYGFYELTKNILKSRNENINKSALYLISTCVAECMSSIVRLPFEIVKQRMQVCPNNTISCTINNVLQTQNLGTFLLKTYLILVLRDIPFDCIQYGLWETFKDLSKS